MKKQIEKIAKELDFTIESYDTWRDTYWWQNIKVRLSYGGQKRKYTFTDKYILGSETGREEIRARFREALEDIISGNGIRFADKPEL